MADPPMISANSLNLKVSGILVKIDLLFLLVLVFGLLGGQFKEILALFLGLFVHELAHILTANSLGAKVEEVHVLPFGAKIRLDLLETSPNAEMLIILAGPMANFIIIIFLLTAFTPGHIPPEITPYINRQLQLGFFNLMPALPLDGGRIFELWLRERTNYIYAVRGAAKAGKIFALSLFTLSLWSLYQGRGALHLVVPALFMYFYALKEEQAAPLVFMGQVAKKKDKVIKKGLLQVETLVVMANTPAKDLLYLFAPQKYYIVYVVNTDLRIERYLTETEIFDGILHKGLDIEVKDIV